MKPGKTGIARLIDATRYSWQGLKACYRHEAAFRQEVALAVVLLPLSFFVARTVEQWILLVAPLLICMIVELLNSAIENVVDRISDEKHELSGRAKDMGSAAVFICLWIVVICWGLIGYENFLANGIS